MPRQVTFQEDEVSAIYKVERLDRQLAKELFYQPEDYTKFRSAYRLFKENQLHMERMKRFAAMTQQARYEMQMQQQVKLIMAVSSLSSSQQLLQLPIQSASPIRRPKQSQGVAAMA